MTDQEEELPPADYGDFPAIIGEVVIAWNVSQFLLCEIFAELSGLEWDKAAAIFFALRTDAAQRDITSALIPICLPKGDQICAKLVTAIFDLGQMAGERNAAMHTIWGLETPENKVVAAPFVKSHGSLRPDFEEQFRKLTAKLNSLHSRLDEIHEALRRANSIAR